DRLAQLAHRLAVADDLGAHVEARLQIGVLALEAAVLERAGDTHQCLFEREGLLDEVVRAQPRGLHRRLDRAVAGDHDDRRLRTHAPELGQGLEAIHPGHPDVEEDDVGRLVGDEAHGRFAGAGRAHAIALVLQHRAQRALNGRLVVDDEDVLARHAQASTGAGVRVTGTSMTKRVPEGWLSSTRIVPPCSVTISLTIGRPSPMPFTFVEKYGRNSLSRSSLGIPGPVSATTSRTRGVSGTYS